MRIRIRHCVLLAQGFLHTTAWAPHTICKTARWRNVHRERPVGTYRKLRSWAVCSPVIYRPYLSSSSKSLLRVKSEEVETTNRPIKYGLKCKRTDGNRKCKVTRRRWITFFSSFSCAVSSAVCVCVCVYTQHPLMTSWWRGLVEQKLVVQIVMVPTL